MLCKRVLIVLAAVAVLGLTGKALAGEDQAGGRRGNFNPEEMRKRMDERMKTSMGVTDEEWKVLQPRLEKVQTLCRQIQGGGMMGMMGGRRGPRGADQAAGAPAPAPTTELEKKTTALQTLLENKDAKPEDIKTALTDLRDERAKAKDELEKAKKELREALTVRQEAQLVLMNVLE